MTDLKAPNTAYRDEDDPRFMAEVTRRYRALALADAHKAIDTLEHWIQRHADDLAREGGDAVETAVCNIIEAKDGLIEAVTDHWEDPNG